MSQVCSVCGVEAVATCADCGEGLCWSHGDGLPAGTPGRLHATCASLAASLRANEARELARSVARASFVDRRSDLIERVRVIWLVVGEDRDDDPQRRFRRLADVVVVLGHRGGGPAEAGLGVDPEGHFWDLGSAAAAPLATGGPAALRPGRWPRRRFRAAAIARPELVVAPPLRGLTGTRRRSDDLGPATVGDDELRALRALAVGEPGPVLAC